MNSRVNTAVFVGVLFALYSPMQMLAQVPGGFTERDVTDEDVVAAAKFAVKTAAAEMKIKPDRILGAASQVVAGTNYRLHLRVIDRSGDKPRKREAVAVVYQDLCDKYKLTSWKWRD